MQMRLFAHLAVLTFGIAITGSSIAAPQETDPSRISRHPITGYQDANGVFHPFARGVADAATSQTYTGTLEVTFNITVKSTLPKGYVLYCSATFDATSLNEVSPTSSIDYGEDAFSAASGSTCTITIPYSWTLNIPSTTVQNSYSGSYEVYAINPTATTLLGAAQLRLVSSGIVDSAKIPATGATTKFTIAVTI